MRAKYLTLAIVFVLSCAASSIAQQNDVRKHRVTINVKRGEPIKGEFVRADADTVQVDIGSAQATVKLDDVVSIVFFVEGAKAEQEQSFSSQPTQATLDAIKALRKVDGATQIGITFLQYVSLLVETKGAVDEALVVLPEGELKRELRRAMEDYIWARQAWSASLQSPGATGVPTGSELAAALNERYSLGLTLKKGRYLDRELILEAIWKSAHSHVENAASLSNR